jgi:hypothetical protein
VIDELSLVVVFKLERTFDEVRITDLVLEDDNCKADDVGVLTVKLLFFMDDVGLMIWGVLENALGIDVDDIDSGKEVTLTLNLTPAKIEDLTGSGMISGKNTSIWFLGGGRMGGGRKPSYGISMSKDILVFGLSIKGPLAILSTASISTPFLALPLLS